MSKLLMKRFLMDPDAYRSVVITDNQINIIKWIGQKWATSREYADYKKKSIQLASSQLHKLWLRGYLIRRETIDPSGGIAYEYKEKK